MTAWPKYNPEAHEPWMPRASTALMCRRCRDLCGEPIPCRCCETARADEAEAALKRVREFCEQQVKDRSGWSDDRHKFDLSYIDGWNDALDRVEQALGGGTS